MDVCLDINECTSSPCEQMCMNNEGSYECSCDAGYSLDNDQHSCNGVFINQYCYIRSWWWILVTAYSYIAKMKPVAKWLGQYDLSWDFKSGWNKVYMQTSDINRFYHQEFFMIAIGSIFLAILITNSYVAVDTLTRQSQSFS